MADQRTVRIPAITCRHCAQTIERELLALPGVLGIAVDVEDRTVRLDWLPPATWDQIAALLAEIGYPAEG